MKVLLLISIALNVWLAVTVIKLENIHYGILVGSCIEQERASIQDPMQRPRYLQCLEQTETRTSAWYHLGYALGIL